MYIIQNQFLKNASVLVYSDGLVTRGSLKEKLNMGMQEGPTSVTAHLAHRLEKSTKVTCKVTLANEQW